MSASEKRVDRTFTIPRELSEWITSQAPRNASRFMEEILYAYRDGRVTPPLRCMSRAEASAKLPQPPFKPQPMRNYGQR